MSMSLEDAVLNVWRQSLAGNKKTVTLEGESFPVRSTAKRKLKQIDFQFDGKDLRGLEQNPDTKSRWAAMARNGKKNNAVLGRWKVCCGRNGWESTSLRTQELIQQRIM